MKNNKIALMMGLALISAATGLAMEKNPFIAKRMWEEYVGPTRTRKGTDWKMVYAVLNSGPHININQDRHSKQESDTAMTLLGWAVYEGNVEAAKTLIEKYNADPNVSLFPNKQVKPLHWAEDVRKENTMANMLRAHGAK